MGSLPHHTHFSLSLTSKRMSDLPPPADKKRDVPQEQKAEQGSPKKAKVDEAKEEGEILMVEERKTEDVVQPNKGEIAPEAVIKPEAVLETQLEEAPRKSEIDIQREKKQKILSLIFSGIKATKDVFTQAEQDRALEPLVEAFMKE